MVVVLALVFVLSAVVTIYLLIRTGDTRVPNVLGKSEAEARQIIKKAGLRVFEPVAHLNDDKYAPDTIFKTDPAPDSSVKKDSLVRLYISTGPSPNKPPQVELGPDEVRVPDLSGKTPAEAKAAAEQAGFKVEMKSRSDATVPTKTVIDTDPSAGTPVKKGSKLTINVSSGPPKPKNQNGNSNISRPPANANRG